jgi:hypothetical protein
LKEIQCLRHPEILARTALVLFATITGERVQRPSRDFRILVVDRRDESRDGDLIKQAVEQVDTESPDSGFLML